MYRFVYCGKIDLVRLQEPDILKLLIAANELKIQTLILCTREYLIKHQHSSFLQQNPINTKLLQIYGMNVLKRFVLNQIYYLNLINLSV